MRNIKNSKVAVVGGAGFLGSHAVNHLIEDRDCKVTVIDNLCAGRREFVHPRADFIHHDITTSEAYLCTLFKELEIEYVFNWAAHPYVPLSFERPSHVFMTNAVGAMNVINAAHEAGVKGILQVSSAEIYGGLDKERTEYWHNKFRELATTCRDNEETPYGLSEDEVTQGFKIPENQPVSPHSSYGASKAAIDFYVQSRWKEANVPALSLRQFNCVGERETHPYVVPEIIGQLFRNKTSNGGLSIRLGNNSVRDFLYAGDAVRYAVELLEKGEFGAVYNLGSESGVKIYDLAQMLADVVNAGRIHVVEEAARKRPWEIWHLQSDNTKINGVCSYRPAVPLKEALARAVEWFRGNGERWPWEGEKC